MCRGISLETLFKKTLVGRDLLVQVRERFVEMYGADIEFGEERRSKQFRAIETSIMAATLSRRLIMCNDYVGLGPAATKSGDEVHLLMCSRTPFVLRPVAEAHLPSELTPTGRPVKNWTGPRATAYEVIGDCYVHGLMDGDVKNDSSQEWKTIPLI
jgi:hypothetical protein